MASTQSQQTPTAPCIDDILLLKQVTSEMLSCDSQGDKLGSFKEKYPDLGNKFPGVFAMCCGDMRDPQQLAFTTRCISFMLKKLEDSHATTTHTSSTADMLHHASTEVGEMLFDKYVKPHVQKNGANRPMK